MSMTNGWVEPRRTPIDESAGNDEAEGLDLCDLPSQAGVYHAGEVRQAGPFTSIITLRGIRRLLMLRQLLESCPFLSVLVRPQPFGTPDAFSNSGIRVP